MLYGRVVIALIYAGDVIFFSLYQDNIYEVIKELEDYGISLTIEDDVINMV